MPNLDTTILHIYQGLLASDGFRACLAAVANALGGHLAALHDENLSDGGSRVMTAGLPERELGDLIASYELRWSAANPWMAASLPSMLSDGVEHGDAVVPRQDLLRSDYYRKLLRPLGIEHSLGMRVAWTPEKRLAVATFNRDGQSGIFDDDAVSLAQRLRPHLECAFMLHQLLGTALAECVALKAALDHAAVGLILLEADGRVRAMNAIAEHTLERLKVGHLSFSGCLEFKDRQLREQWTRVLGADEKSPRELRIQGALAGSCGALLRLHVLPPSPPVFGEAGIRWVATVNEIDAPSAASAELRSMLRSALGMTGREADVAMALREHGSAPAAAVALGVAPSTVRAHLKSIFGKLDVQRQSELIRRVERLVRE